MEKTKFYYSCINEKFALEPSFKNISNTKKKRKRIKGIKLYWFKKSRKQSNCVQ